MPILNGDNVKEHHCISPAPASLLVAEFLQRTRLPLNTSVFVVYLTESHAVNCNLQIHLEINYLILFFILRLVVQALKLCQLLNCQLMGRHNHFPPPLTMEMQLDNTLANILENTSPHFRAGRCRAMAVPI
jgi:hypothetical protein